MPQHGVTALIKADREDYYTRLAMTAHAASERGDMKGVFGVVKRLTGFSIRPPKTFKMNDGSLTESVEQRDKCALQHCCNAVGGELVEKLADLATDPDSVCPTPSGFEVSPVRLSRAIAHLGRGKGLGVDGVPAELLQAGASALAVKLSELCEQIMVNEIIPVAWKGGRLVDLYKRQRCDQRFG